VRTPAWFTLCMLAGCGKKEVALPAVDLPLAAHAAVPADAGSMLYVTLRKDGRILAGEGNAPLTLEQLGHWLVEHRGSPENRASDATVCIRAERTVPWQHVQWVLATCADNWIWRTRFAARAKADGPEGAVDAFLPRGMPQTVIRLSVHVVARKEMPVDYAGMKVMKPTEFRYRYGDQETTDLQTVTKYLRDGVKVARGTEGVTVKGEIKAAHKVPMEAIVSLLDAYHAAGLESVEFYGPGTPTPEQRHQAPLPYPLKNYDVER